MSDMPNYAKSPKMDEFKLMNPIPLFPYLRLRADHTGCKIASERLDAIVAGFVPNTVDWGRKFKTKPPYLNDKAVHGVRLVTEE